MPYVPNHLKHRRYSHQGSDCNDLATSVQHMPYQNHRKLCAPEVSTPIENSPVRRLKNPHLRMLAKADQREARGWSRRSSEAPFLSYWLVCGTARSSQGRAGFARRSGPLTARTVLQAVARKKGSRSFAVLLRPGKQACLSPVF